MVLEYTFVFLLSLCIGSFVAAMSFRLVEGISVYSPRSFCPKCKKKIRYYDNIPLLSYFVLKGRCRNCGKKIAKRYPIIEGSTAIFLTFFYHLYKNCSFGCPFWEQPKLVTLPLLFIVSTVLIAVFVIDLEKQMIPDILVFFLFVLVLATLLGFDTPDFYSRLFGGFASGSFLLILHLVTYGKGMGLGDVKLALPVGMILGFGLSVVWLFLSFFIGAVFGVVLILLKKAKFGEHIAFGPFLIFAFFITFFWGKQIFDLLFPAFIF